MGWRLSQGSGQNRLPDVLVTQKTNMRRSKANRKKDKFSAVTNTKSNKKFNNSNKKEMAKVI